MGGGLKTAPQARRDKAFKAMKAAGEEERGCC